MSSAYFESDFPTMQPSSEIMDFYFAFFPTMTTCGVDSRGVLIKKEELHKARLGEKVHDKRFHGAKEHFEKFWLETDWFRESEQQKCNAFYLQDIWKRLYSFRLAVYAHYEVEHSEHGCQICAANDELENFRDTMVEKRKLQRVNQIGAIKHVGAPPLVIKRIGTSNMATKLQLDLDTRRGVKRVSSKYFPPAVLIDARLDKTTGYQTTDAAYRKAYTEIVKLYNVESAKSAMRAAAFCNRRDSVEKPKVQAKISLLDKVSDELVEVLAPEPKTHPWRCLASSARAAFCSERKDPWRPLSVRKLTDEPEPHWKPLNKSLKQRHSWKCLSEVISFGVSGSSVGPETDAFVEPLLIEEGITEEGCPQFKIDWGIDCLIDSVLEGAFEEDDESFCDDLEVEEPLRFAAVKKRENVCPGQEFDWKLDSLFGSVHECFKDGELGKEQSRRLESPAPEDFDDALFEYLDLTKHEVNWVAYPSFEGGYRARDNSENVAFSNSSSPAKENSDGAVSSESDECDFNSLLELGLELLSSVGSSAREAHAPVKERGDFTETLAAQMRGKESLSAHSDLLTFRDALEMEPEQATEDSKTVCNWIKNKGKKIKNKGKRIKNILESVKHEIASVV